VGAERPSVFPRGCQAQAAEGACHQGETLRPNRIPPRGVLRLCAALPATPGRRGVLREEGCLLFRTPYRCPAPCLLCAPLARAGPRQRQPRRLTSTDSDHHHASRSLPSRQAQRRLDSGRRRGVSGNTTRRLWPVRTPPRCTSKLAHRRPAFSAEASVVLAVALLANRQALAGLRPSVCPQAHEDRIRGSRGGALPWSVDIESREGWHLRGAERGTPQDDEAHSHVRETEGPIAQHPSSQRASDAARDIYPDRHIAFRDCLSRRRVVLTPKNPHRPWLPPQRRVLIPSRT